MRRIVAFNRLSADGYFSGDDGNLDWFVPDDRLDREAAEAIPGFDTMLFGRRTYDLFASFWPNAVDDSPTAPDPHGAGRRSTEIRAMALWLNETPKVVFSRTLSDASWKNSRLVHELDAGEVKGMKSGLGRDMIVFGSGSIVSQLTEHGLIDEYRFIVNPVLLGSGQSVVRGLSESVSVTLLEANQYESGNVLLRYARTNRVAG